MRFYVIALKNNLIDFKQSFIKFIHINIKNLLKQSTIKSIIPSISPGPPAGGAGPAGPDGAAGAPGGGLGESPEPPLKKTSI